MTATEETTENVVAETTEAAAVKYPTYRELAGAVWKLAYKLCFDEDAFCSDGTNEYLRRFGLPELVHVDGNEELKDKYLDAWFNYTHFTTTTWTEQDDAYARANLARTVRDDLERNEPKSRATMSAWLNELGLESFAPPAPPRHIGRYDVSYNASNQVNSAVIRNALRSALADLDVQVSYVGRIDR